LSNTCEGEFTSPMPRHSKGRRGESFGLERLLGGEGASPPMRGGSSHKSRGKIVMTENGNLATGQFLLI